MIACHAALAQLTSQQKQQKLDSLHDKLQKDSLHIFRFQKLRPYLAIDSRNSWIKNENGTKNVPINVNGLQLGVIIKERHTVGLGFYSMNNSSKDLQKLTDQNKRVTYQSLKMNYATLFYQYVIVDKRYFELDLPLEVGLGHFDYYLADSARQVIPKSAQSGTVRLTGGGVNIVLKPLRWIGLNAMGGCRFVVFDQRTKLNFNGVYYSYGVWVDIRQIIRDTNYYLIKKHRYKKQVKLYA